MNDSREVESSVINTTSDEEPTKRTEKSDCGVSFCPKKYGQVQRLHVCNVCGKEFKSPKALFGHLRIHSGKARRLRDELFSAKSAVNHAVLQRVGVPDEPRVCSSSAFSELSFDETKKTDLVMEDRSYVNKHKASSSRISFPSFKKSSFVAEVEQEEMEEVAMSLMMLSEVESPDQNSQRVNREARSSFDSPALCDKQEKIKPVIDNPLIHTAELKPNSSGLQTLPGFSGYRCKACHKFFCCYQALGGHQSLHRSRRRHFASKKRNFEGDSLPAASVSEVSETGSETNECEVMENQTKSGYRCKICHEVFRCFRALGGHQSLHRSRRHDFGSERTKFEGDSSPGGASASVEASKTCSETKLRNVNLKEHKCSVCPKVLATDQALGAHMTHHSTKGLEMTAERGEISAWFDLNIDEDSSDDLSNQQWMKT